MARASVQKTRNHKARIKETDLYPPIKAFLEAQGFEVKAEIGACDVMALRQGEAPVIVEMKTGFSLQLLYQGINRQQVTDFVYLAIPLPPKKVDAEMLRLCRKLGLGLLCVSGNWVEPYLDPGPYAPRLQAKRRSALLKEFHNRKGDPNKGGSTRMALVTAYRQDALRCLLHIETHGASRLKDITQGAGVPRASSIVRGNVYGWFEKVERGVYALTLKAHEQRAVYSEVIASLIKTGD